MVDGSLGWQLLSLTHHALATCASTHLYSAGIRAPWRRRGAGQRTELLWGKLLVAEAAIRTGERGHLRMPSSVTADEVWNIRISQIDLCFGRLRVQCIEQEGSHHPTGGSLHSEIFTVEFKPK